MQVEKYSNFLCAVGLFVNFIIGIKYSILLDLGYASYSTNNKYMYMLTTLFLSYIINGFIGTCSSIFLTFIGYQFYLNKIGKSDINNVAKGLYSKLIEYQFMVNIKKKLDNVIIPNYIVNANEKFNVVADMLKKYVLSYIIKYMKMIENRVESYFPVPQPATTMLPEAVASQTNMVTNPQTPEEMLNLLEAAMKGNMNFSQEEMDFMNMVMKQQ
jgi:hypothetical protein